MSSSGVDRGRRRLPGRGVEPVARRRLLEGGPPWSSVSWPMPAPSGSGCGAPRGSPVRLIDHGGNTRTCGSCTMRPAPSSMAHAELGAEEPIIGMIAPRRYSSRATAAGRPWCVRCGPTRVHRRTRPGRFAACTGFLDPGRDPIQAGAKDPSVDVSNIAAGDRTGFRLRCSTEGLRRPVLGTQHAAPCTSGCPRHVHRGRQLYEGQPRVKAHGSRFRARERVRGACHGHGGGIDRRGREGIRSVGSPGRQVKLRQHPGPRPRRFRGYAGRRMVTVVSDRPPPPHLAQRSGVGRGVRAEMRRD